MVVSSGSARSLIREKGKLKNFRKYEIGAVIGAASIMTGHPCENYTAGDGLEAFSIEEELWSKLYENDEKFKNWCNSQIWIEEVAFLISKKVDNFPKNIENSYELISKLINDQNICNKIGNNGIIHSRRFSNDIVLNIFVEFIIEFNEKYKIH